MRGSFARSPQYRGSRGLEVTVPEESDQLLFRMKPGLLAGIDFLCAALETVFRPAASFPELHYKCPYHDEFRIRLLPRLRREGSVRFP
jgi:hypothetical protein